MHLNRICKCNVTVLFETNDYFPHIESIVFSPLFHLGGESSTTHRFRHRSQESLESNSNGVENGGGSDSLQQLHNGGNVDMDTDLWLECDDENISVITRRQFEEELNSKQSSTTPYLLFYERV